MVHVRVGRINFKTGKKHCTFVFRQELALFWEIANHPIRCNGDHASDGTFLKKKFRFVNTGKYTMMKIQAQPDFPLRPFILAMANARRPPKDPARIEAEKNQT